MSKIYGSVKELIGKTPLLEIHNIEKELALKGKILAKLEYLNPAGSAKDRIGFAMTEDAEEKGLLKKGMLIIEPTSGNTGIGLAMAAAVKGYKAVFTMPDTMSEERINILKAYGADIVLTDGKKGMAGAVEKAEEIAKEKGGFIPSQFNNPANPLCHEKTTGPEIWEDTDGKADIFIAGVGTGGTLTGAGRFLKSKNPDIKIIAVEPYDSPLLSGGRAGAHGLQGIGANFIPKTLDTSIYNEVFAVKTDEALYAAKLLAKKEGILVGISSGAALYAAVKYAEREENTDKNIVVILPDSGDRYYSTKLFDN